MRELLARLLRRPASAVVEVPVRDLVHETLRSQDLPSTSEFSELKRELARANQELHQLAQRVDALGGTIEALRDERDALLAAAPSPEPAEPTSRRCKVPGCEGDPKSKGFCKAHYGSWRKGELVGFVGPRGRVEHASRVLVVPMRHQGEPVTVTGQKRFTVKVDGEKVAFELLG